jgi:cytochrome P450
VLRGDPRRGPVVWLARHRMWAMGRYEDVRAALRDDETFLSGDGVAANPVTNALGRKTTLSSDGDTHAARRRVLMRSLDARALASVEERLQAEADAVVDSLVATRDFDGVKHFASALPVRVIADLVGVRVPSDQLLRWGRRTFDALGPINRRTLGAGPTSLGMWLYSQRLREAKVEPGSWAASVFAAAQAGDVSTVEAKTMVIDFVAPSLDTTILAAGHMLWRLGVTPGLWERVRGAPSLIPAAAVESVRLASPIRGFTRRVARDTELDGARLLRGERVVLLYASANMDESQFPDPERFDLDRPAGGHLGWGNGPHTCVGIHLAKLELQALLRAMVPRVSSIHVGRPAPLRNNTLQGFESLPARFDPVI